MDVKKPYMVGLTGGSASGKTTFLSELRELFTMDEVCILSQDNYYKAVDDQPKDLNGQINFDLPQCIDQEAFKSDITKLKNGQSVQRQRYRFQHPDQFGEWIEFKPAPILIVEGLFVFQDEEILPQIDLKLFMEASADIQLERRIKRDTSERNVPLDKIHYQWEHHVVPAFNAYLLPHRESADLVILNNRHFQKALKMLEDHFKRILESQISGL